MDPDERCVRRGHVAERQVGVDRVVVELDGASRPLGEQALELGGEHDESSVRRPVQRLDAEPVAGDDRAIDEACPTRPARTCRAAAARTARPPPRTGAAGSRCRSGCGTGGSPTPALRRIAAWLYSSPFCIPHTTPSSEKNGWCPPSTSTIDNRRTPNATPGAMNVPRSSGPRCVIASVITSSRHGSTTSRGTPRNLHHPTDPAHLRFRYRSRAACDAAIGQPPPCTDASAQPRASSRPRADSRHRRRRLYRLAPRPGDSSSSATRSSCSTAWRTRSTRGRARARRRSSSSSSATSATAALADEALRGRRPRRPPRRRGRRRASRCTRSTATREVNTMATATLPRAGRRAERRGRPSRRRLVDVDLRRGRVRVRRARPRRARPAARGAAPRARTGSCPARTAARRSARSRPARRSRCIPTSVYAITKRDHEELCLVVGAAYGIPTVALRFFNVYGPGQALSNPYTGVAAIFASRLLNGTAAGDLRGRRAVARLHPRLATSSRGSSSRSSPTSAVGPGDQPRHRPMPSGRRGRAASRSGLGVESSRSVTGRIAPATSATASRTRRWRGAAGLRRRRVRSRTDGRPGRVARRARRPVDRVDAATRAR